MKEFIHWFRERITTKLLELDVTIYNSICSLLYFVESILLSNSVKTLSWDTHPSAWWSDLKRDCVWDRRKHQGHWGFGKFQLYFLLQILWNLKESLLKHCVLWFGFIHLTWTYEHMMSWKDDDGSTSDAYDEPYERKSVNDKLIQNYVSWRRSRQFNWKQD